MRRGDLQQLVEPLREAPEESAVLFDVDGTLAPIVEDPAQASVPEPTRAALRKLAGRFALVACVSGRRSLEARRLVGVEELTYAGNHGLEVLGPGEQESAFDVSLGNRANAAREFVPRWSAQGQPHTDRASKPRRFEAPSNRYPPRCATLTTHRAWPCPAR